MDHQSKLHEGEPPKRIHNFLRDQSRRNEKVENDRRTRTERIEAIDKQISDHCIQLVRYSSISESFVVSTPDEFKAKTVNIYIEVKRDINILRNKKVFFDHKLCENVFKSLDRTNDALAGALTNLDRYLKTQINRREAINEELDLHFVRLRQYKENHSQFFTGPQLERFEQWLNMMEKKCQEADLQIRKFLLGGDVSQKMKREAFEELRSINDTFRVVEKSLHELNAINQEIDRRSERLFAVADSSKSFTDDAPRVFRRKLQIIEEECQAANRQIQDYLFGIDRNEKRKNVAFERLLECNESLKKGERLLDNSDDDTHLEIKERVLDRSLERIGRYAQAKTFVELVRQQFPDWEELRERSFPEWLVGISEIFQDARSVIKSEASEANTQEKDAALKWLDTCITNLKKIEETLDQHLQKEAKRLAVCRRESRAL